MVETITCPNCSYEIEVSAALAAQLREQLRKELETEVRKREENLRQREQTLEQEVARRLDEERGVLAEDAQRKAHQTVILELQDLQDQLSETRSKLDDAQRTELQLRKERRELEDQKREIELTVSRKLDEERSQIREQAKNEAIEENRLSVADKDKLIDDLRDQITGLKRVAEQGSQQAQGEVMEAQLEDLLHEHFPLDAILAVPKGSRGADVLQQVRDDDGRVCGAILWESKRTKSWNDGWLPKLREDQRAAKADLAVLFTLEMPKDCTTFACIDGVWVTNRSCLVGLAAALRIGLIELARTRRSVEGRQTKLEVVYQYLSGQEFRQRIQGIAEALIASKQDLEAEKRSARRQWAKRDKQLERALAHTAGLYGDLAGIIGASLPQIDALELPAIEPGLPMDDNLLTDETVAQSPF